ncbi:MAG: VWA domain-containing protein [Hyphomicrobiaceae bacterium]
MRPRASFLELFRIDRMRSWRSNEEGGVAIIFALSITMLFGVVGSAVDMGRWVTARSETRNAMDGALLAAGRTLQLPEKTEADALAVAETYYESNKSKVISSGKVSFEIVDNGTAIRASSSVVVATPFLAVIGMPELPVDGSAKAVLQVGGQVGTHIEVSLMLDVTGSMDGQKLTDLKTAAKDLIDIVVWDDQSQYTSRVAIAPFSKYVNVGRDHFKAVTGSNSGGSSNPLACVEERKTADRYTDAAPGTGNYFQKGPTDADCQPTTALLPLTNDRNRLKSVIDGFAADGGTAGHLGTHWAWNLLSPRWTSVWPAASAPRPYGEITTKGPKGNPLLQKIAVLMTDGEYNTWYSGDSSTTQARAICDNIKATGIKVYAIGFQIAAGGDAETTLKGCASGSEYYYNAEDGASLREAFRDIALRIATLRLAE